MLFSQSTYFTFTIIIDLLASISTILDLFLLPSNLPALLELPFFFRHLKFFSSVSLENTLFISVQWLSYQLHQDYLPYQSLKLIPGYYSIRIQKGLEYFNSIYLSPNLYSICILIYLNPEKHEYCFTWLKPFRHKHIFTIFLLTTLLSTQDNFPSDK